MPGGKNKNWESWLERLSSKWLANLTENHVKRELAKDWRLQENVKLIAWFNNDQAVKN
jgi:hypothetical protein